MINWFEIFADRLTAIEENQRELLTLLSRQTPSLDVNPYGDFKWLKETCVGIPESTLRVKSASGEIPGLCKVGKRALYEKALVLGWIRSQQLTHKTTSQINQEAHNQFEQQHERRGGRRAA